MSFWTQQQPVKPAPANDHQVGFNLYATGKSEAACTNNAQLAGWRSACRAEAACATIDMMAAAGRQHEIDSFLESI